MQKFLIVIHLIVTVLLIGTVLMQRSEGGALGIGGGGGGGNLFSSRGVGNALTRATAILAACFFVTSISLAVLASRQQGGGSLFDAVAPATQQTPAAADKAPADSKVPDALMPKLDGSAPAAPAPAQAPAQ
jgi:preprotein translocase subunit SecG